MRCGLRRIGALSQRNHHVKSLKTIQIPKPDKGEGLKMNLEEARTILAIAYLRSPEATEDFAEY